MNVMLAYWNTDAYMYSFVPGIRSQDGYPLVQLHEKVLIRRKGRDEYKIVLKMRRSGLVQRRRFVEVVFDKPVGLVNFTYRQRGRACPGGRHRFEVLTVTIPPPRPPLPKEHVHDYPYDESDPRTSQVLKLLRQGTFSALKPKKVNLAVIPGTTIGLAFEGLWIQQKRQKRRRPIDAAEGSLMRVLNARLMQLKAKEEKFVIA